MILVAENEANEDAATFKGFGASLNGRVRDLRDHVRALQWRARLLPGRKYAGRYGVVSDEETSQLITRQ